MNLDEFQILFLNFTNQNIFIINFIVFLVFFLKIQNVKLILNESLKQNY